MLANTRIMFFIGNMLKIENNLNKKGDIFKFSDMTYKLVPVD